MAIFFKSASPSQLLEAYKQAIDAGHIDTWSCDSDGDFTHTVSQWNREAWLRPKMIDESTLAFFILGRKEKRLSVTTYAVYHGRFIESMLAHCDGLFNEAHATALPVDGDNI